MVTDLIYNKYTGIFIFLVIVGVGLGLGLGLTNGGNIDGKGETNTQNFRQNFEVTYYNTEGTNIQDGFSRYLEEAMTFWGDKLLEDTKIKLDVRATPLNNRTTLAYGSMNDRNDIRAGGDITINLNANAMSWTDVLKHEIGHVMGIGLAYTWSNAVIGTDGVYYLSSSVFPETYQIYQNDYNGVEYDIPLGDVSGHFDESIFTTELMTPYSNEGQRQPITDLTLSALSTLGWNIDMTKAEEKN